MGAGWRVHSTQSPPTTHSAPAILPAATQPTGLIHPPPQSIHHHSGDKAGKARQPVRRGASAAYARQPRLAHRTKSLPQAADRARAAHSIHTTTGDAAEAGAHQALHRQHAQGLGRVSSGEGGPLPAKATRHPRRSGGGSRGAVEGVGLPQEGGGAGCRAATDPVHCIRFYCLLPRVKCECRVSAGSRSLVMGAGCTRVGWRVKSPQSRGRMMGAGGRVQGAASHEREPEGGGCKVGCGV